MSNNTLYAFDNIIYTMHFSVWLKPCPGGSAPVRVTEPPAGPPKIDIDITSDHFS